MLSCLTCDCLKKKYCRKNIFKERQNIAGCHLYFEDIFDLFRPSFKMAYSLARKGFSNASIIVIVTSFEIICRECIVYALTEDRRRLRAFGEKTFKLKDLLESNFGEEIIRKMIRSVDFLNLKESNSAFQRVYNFGLKNVADTINPSTWTLLKLTILLRHQIVHHGGNLNESFKQQFDELLQNLGKERKTPFQKIIGKRDITIEKSLNVLLLTNMESFLNEMLERVAKEFGI